MDNITKANQVITNNNGLANIADFLSNGLTQKTVERLCNDGHLIRVRRGYYISPDFYVLDEEYIKKFIPEAVISLESALFHYDYIDFCPR